ncbi:MAG: Flp pilus assembly protein CpaB [Candidatus Binatus sp.]|uniref:Flp pilus assembly protein CpaB n=1 Tax=Candidatus Binatus sp. TaxID=2811406 RepID=UPI002722D6C7|nr:Flp pilus assembly protein CpaB [Candidatus Binatus sp.]MDO8431816.1 Flp pilus assembly protein CpaB [Candidatus Binatus sp.]
MKRQKIFVLVAGVAAMLASIMVYSALKRREAEVQKATARNVQVLVAAFNLPLGSKIGPDAVKMTRWSAESVPDGAYTDPKQVLGSYVKNSMVANEPIVGSKLFTGDKTAGVMPLLIPFGMRAVSVPVDEVSDIAGFVLPHTHVDILVAINGGGVEKPFSKVVLQNIEVLAVAQEVEMKKDEPTIVKVVTLLVSPPEAERLSLASREGTLRLAMRNYNDNKIVLTSGTDIQQMLRAYSSAPEIPVMPTQPAAHHALLATPRRAPVEVEILRNGKSSESVSFVNEAAADNTTSKPSRHARRDTAEMNRVAADASKPAPAAVAMNPAPASAPAAIANSATPVAASAAPAVVASAPPPMVDPEQRTAAPLSGEITPLSTAVGAGDSQVPTPKTIDIP